MKVKDAMTSNVVTVAPDTPLKDLATTLVERGISGVPVVDAEGRVIGVVAEQDILYKEAATEHEGGLLRHLFGHSDREAEAKLQARTAGEAMTSPAITIGPRAPVAEAAALMVERHVDRLPVVEINEKLVGIVTRGDLVRAFARPDAELANELRELLEDFWLLPEQVTVQVRRGDVVLSGVVDSKENAEALIGAVRETPGVMSVESQLDWRTENRAFSA